MNHVMLRAEILTDPARRGYKPRLDKPNREDCARIAKLLNEPIKVGTAAGTLPVLQVLAMLPDNALVPRVTTALTVCGETVDLSESSDFRVVLATAKADATALIAAATATRYEARWQTIGLGSAVGEGDVHSALWPTTDSKVLADTAAAVGGAV